MIKNKKSISPEVALNRAAAYCSQAERCFSDVNDKLLQWGLEENQVEAIMQRLQKENFLSEERYIHAFIHDKFCYEHWGRVKIRYNLRSKQVSDKLVALQLEEVIDDDAYLDTLQTLLKSKLKGIKQPLQTADRAKLYRFAAQRGFESTYISKALKNILANSDDDDDCYDESSME